MYSYGNITKQKRSNSVKSHIISFRQGGRKNLEVD